MSVGVEDNVFNPPIFIIGSPRSGTTMLRLMLTCHPRICVPPEGTWLMQLYRRYHNVVFNEASIEAFIDDILSSPKIEEWQLCRADLLKLLEKDLPQDYAALASRVYLNYAERYGKVRWGDKNNPYLHHIKKIAHLFPSAMFVHIVRDGRDVACSYRDLSQVSGKYAPNLSTNICSIACQWASNVKLVQKNFAIVGTERVLTIRYEDLVRCPEKTLRAICNFLGEDYDSRMLHFAEKNRKNQLEPEVFMGWKALTKEPVTTARVGRWKRNLSEKEQIVFQLLSADVLASYGYELKEVTERSFSLFALRLYSVICFAGQYGHDLVFRLMRDVRSLLIKSSRAIR
jgi:hypothetical protein